MNRFVPTTGGAGYRPDGGRMRYGFSHRQLVDSRLLRPPLDMVHTPVSHDRTKTGTHPTD